MHAHWQQLRASLYSRFVIPRRARAFTTTWLRGSAVEHWSLTITDCL